MNVEELSDEAGRELLGATLREPFVVGHGKGHVRDWFTYLILRFPLWAFQAPAYAALHESELPTTYPLERMIESVFRDEGIGEKQVWLDPLRAELQHRRRAIAHGEAIGGKSPIRREPDGSLNVRGDISGIHLTPDLSLGRPEDCSAEDGDWYVNPYEKLGREVVRLVEPFAFARGKKERAQAERALSDSVRGLAGRLRTGRAGDAPPVYVLKPLVEEGKALVELCWPMFTVSLSDDTRRILADQDVSHAQTQCLWAARLALPIFSACEIEALKWLLEQTNAALPQVRAAGPRRFPVWLLAHRLGVDPQTIARKVGLGARPSGHFKSDNPISRSCLSK